MRPLWCEAWRPSMMVLIAAGLLFRSFDAVMRIDRGFQTEHRVIVQVTPPSAYSSARTSQMVQDFIARSRGVPGVRSVAAVSARPFGDSSTGCGIGAPGGDEGAREVPWATRRLITPGYFATMGIPLLKGRLFRDDETIASDAKATPGTPMPASSWPA